MGRGHNIEITLKNLKCYLYYNIQYLYNLFLEYSQIFMFFFLSVLLFFRAPKVTCQSKHCSSGSLTLHNSPYPSLHFHYIFPYAGFEAKAYKGLSLWSHAMKLINKTVPVLATINLEYPEHEGSMFKSSVKCCWSVTWKICISI